MKFTANQNEVINQINGPVLVVACPGSGKTTTMLGRADHMIKSGIPADKILVVTFTKSAADEMKERFRAKYENDKVTFCTIHHLCYAVVRQLTGMTRDNILPQWKQYAYFREYFGTTVDYNEKVNFIQKLTKAISYVRNADMDPGKYESELTTKEGPINLLRIMNDFQLWKQQQKLVDFDDMLCQCREIFKTRPAVLEYWQDTFPYVIIDEFQDTNIIQADIFYMLAGKYQNICVVGDDDQSIYGFRSANSSIMLDFNKTFPDAKQFFLDTNYRSGKKIVNAAERLIRNNKVRFDKKFEAARPENGKISFYRAGEADKVGKVKLVHEIVKQIIVTGDSYDDIAILYRMNASAINFVSFFENRNIPYQVKDNIPDIHGTFPFVDIKTYWELTKRLDKGLIMKVLNHPSRFLKAEAFKDCDNTKESFYKSARIYARSEREEDRMVRELDRLFRLITMLKGTSPVKFCKILLNGYYLDWVDDYSNFMKVDGKMIRESLKLLQDEAEYFTTMADWISYAEEYPALIAEKSKAKGGVTLSTFHGAKGLEWKHVIIIDADEEVTPYKAAINNEDDKPEEMEEERRMFYVAMTRAKNDLHVVSGNLLTTSRFIYEAGIQKYLVTDNDEDQDTNNKDQEYSRLLASSY